MESKESFSLGDVSAVYEKFFINNVEFVSTIEKLIWGVAFFFPVRFGENELKISALNSGLECFTSLNDFILLKIALLHKLKKIELPKTVPAEMIEKLSHFPPSNVSIASALTTIEHTEVVAEILVTQVSEKYSQLKKKFQMDYYCHDRAYKILFTIETSDHQWGSYIST